MAAAFQLPVLRLLNRVLNDYPAAQSRLVAYAGKTIGVKIARVEMRLRVTVDGRFEMLGDGSADVQLDVTLTIPLRLLPTLALKQESAYRQVEFTGDTELAALLSELARHLKWDVEEDLSHVVGDIAAHRVVDSAKSLHAWGNDASRRLAENIAEYLTEERDVLITQRDAEDFARQVETLRDDTDRLEKRVARLMAMRDIPKAV